MVSLQDFHTVQKPGEISACEHGRLCSLPISEPDVTQFSVSTVLSSYPDINISPSALHSHPSSYATLAANLDDHRRVLMMPTNEPLVKRLTRTFFEEGFIEALNEAQNNAEAHPVISSIAQYLKRAAQATSRLNTFFWPYLKEQGIVSIAKSSETRDWLHCPIRYMRWHPHCFKLAVAASDDTVRIYTDEVGAVPILKNGFQKCITSLAWRPLSAGELAVGCQNGVLLWTLDPKSHIIRPLSQVVCFKSGNHFPVTSIEWNHHGTLLATASINDTDVLMWDVDNNRNTPLKRIGFPCALLKWSPGSQRLCSTTVGNVFRVWETNKWTPERWTVPTGSIQSAAWSPCSSYLLFVTTDASTLFSLQFVEEQLYAAGSVPKQALPVADLTKIQIDDAEVGGKPQSICWNSTGKYVAVIFKDSPSIAIFATSINRHSLSISPSFFLSGRSLDEYPSFICFQEKYPKKQETVLTIAWSTGRVQYFPFIC